MRWVIALDVVVALLGLGALGLAGWLLVVRPGLRLGRAFSALAERAATVTDALAEGARSVSAQAGRVYGGPVTSESTGGPATVVATAARRTI